jgi:hypothetical protein
MRVGGFFRTAGSTGVHGTITRSALWCEGLAPSTISFASGTDLRFRMGFSKLRRYIPHFPHCRHSARRVQDVMLRGWFHTCDLG